MSNGTHLDLFSGIGGFALAARWTGWTTIGFSEIDPYASAVLRKHWPDVPNYGDIRGIKGIKADLVTGGFPCQPYSVAGKRRGASDDRALWPEMLRVIEGSRPTWVLAENVYGIINMELDRVLSDLEELSYATGALVIPACAIDARHRRDRVWIIARVADAGCSGQPGPGELVHPGHPEESTEWETAKPLDGGLANADLEGSQTHGGLRSERERAGECTAGPCRWPDEEEWFTQSGLGRVAHGIPNRSHRLKALGNAIVPQVAAQILQMMAA